MLVSAPKPLANIDHQQNEVHTLQARQSRLQHHPIHRVSPFVNAGRIEKNHLRIGPIRNREDSVPRRLWFVGDDRDLLADESVQKRGLSDVRPTDDRDESGAH